MLDASKPTCAAKIWKTLAQCARKNSYVSAYSFSDSFTFSLSLGEITTRPCHCLHDTWVDRFHPLPTQTKGWRFNFGRLTYIDQIAYLVGMRLRPGSIYIESPHVIYVWHACVVVSHACHFLRSTLRSTIWFDLTYVEACRAEACRNMSNRCMKNGYRVSHMWQWMNLLEASLTLTLKI